MNREYLGNAQDCFKLDYLGYLLCQLDYQVLNIAWMATVLTASPEPPDELQHAFPAEPKTFPAEPKIIQLCKQLRKNRCFSMLQKELPKAVGADFSVVFHNETEKISFGNNVSCRNAYFANVSKKAKQVFFIDPDTGFRPPKSKKLESQHVSYRDFAQVFKRICDDTVIVVYQSFTHKKFLPHFLEIQQKILDAKCPNAYVTSIYWDGKAMFITITKNAKLSEKIDEINKEYAENRNRRNQKDKILHTLTAPEPKTDINSKTMNEKMNKKPQTDPSLAESSSGENVQIQQRREKLAEWRQQGRPYPNDFRRDAWAGELHTKYGEDTAAVAATPIAVKVAGRLLARRVMGKASFAHIEELSGRLQLFIQRDNLSAAAYNAFKKYDIGDIIAAEGVLFHTKMGELTVRVAHLHLLTKSLRPLPEKFHKLSDAETRYRQRYLDLMMNEKTRAVFYARAATIQCIREFLVARNYIEVETPMMQPTPGGAVARPFATHHNALDLDLYLRVAPELYLKRLVVGGFERVFEINRNFRNEGLSTRHNPEFTMLEFYCAYADYGDFIALTETLLRAVCTAVVGSLQLTYQKQTLDFAPPFARYTMREALCHFNPDLTPAQLQDRAALSAIAHAAQIEHNDRDGVGKLQTLLFEKWVEPKLHQPTFITGYPVEVSPLSRRCDDDPTIADRFEFFAAGRELANGFSELNDADDQAERFRHQAAQRADGDAEAMYYDADYIRALEYGLPPTAGEGIGIDRLVMLLTDCPSIRDVILFPHMRPATK